MNGARAVRKYSLSEATARGVCPVCTVLRHRQTRLVEETGIPCAKHLCNHHAWSLAKAGPGAIAADLLLQTLRTRRSEGTKALRMPCDFCANLMQEETDKLDELATKMRTPAFLEWMRLHGTLCLHHAEKIVAQLSPEGGKVIAELVSRTWEELEQGLANYGQHASQGEHAGGGVLGRAAEFLVCQRGIPGEETPC
jgi:hypothetical protein